MRCRFQWHSAFYGISRCEHRQGHINRHEANDNASWVIVGAEELVEGHWLTDEEVGVEHDHDTLCCTFHGTHSTPHRGCILR